MVMFRSGSQDESWRGFGLHGAPRTSSSLCRNVNAIVIVFSPEHLPVCSCFSCLPYASSIRSVQWQGLFFGSIGIGVGTGIGIGIGGFWTGRGMAHPASICCGPSYWWVRQLKCNNRFELLIGWVWERRATTAAVSQMRNAFKSYTRMMYICTYYRHCSISSLSLNAHPALQPHSNYSFDLWVSLSSGDFPNRLEHVFPARTSLSSKSWGKQVKGSSFEDFFWPLAYSILGPDGFASLIGIKLDSFVFMNNWSGPSNLTDNPPPSINFNYIIIISVWRRRVEGFSDEFPGVRVSVTHKCQTANWC